MSGKLRMIAGQFGGRFIHCPASCARPTTDRVREAIFSSIISLYGSLDDISVCDAFAGSGALGFEALSRGAARVQFFDESSDAISILQKNAAVLGVQNCIQIQKRNVFSQGLAGRFAPYQMIFLDPPYAASAEEVAMLVRLSCKEGICQKDTLVVYEHGATSEQFPEEDTWRLVKSKVYGKTMVDFYLL